MGSLEKYGPVIAGGLAVLAFGLWNPRFLQRKVDDRYSGHPSVVWLAAIAILVGVMFQAFNPIEELCKRI